MEITVFNLSVSEFKPAFFAFSVLYPKEIRYRYGYRDILRYIYLLKEREYCLITDGKEKRLKLSDSTFFYLSRFIRHTTLSLSK